MTSFTLFPHKQTLTFGHGSSQLSEMTGNSQAEVWRAQELLWRFVQENHVTYLY